jgi:hypothetical protein
MRMFHVFAPVPKASLRLGSSRISLLPALMPAAGGRSNAGVSAQATFR